MLNKIIHLLGGRTNEDVKALEGNYEQWRARCLASEQKIEALEKEIELKNERLNIMIDLISKYVGFTRISEEKKDPPKNTPIQTQPMSWARARRVYEKREQVKESLPPDAKVS